MFRFSCDVNTKRYVGESVASDFLGRRRDKSLPVITHENNEQHALTSQSVTCLVSNYRFSVQHAPWDNSSEQKWPGSSLTVGWNSSNIFSISSTLRRWYVHFLSYSLQIDFIPSNCLSLYSVGNFCNCRWNGGSRLLADLSPAFFSLFSSVARAAPKRRAVLSAQERVVMATRLSYQRLRVGQVTLFNEADLPPDVARFMTLRVGDELITELTHSMQIHWTSTDDGTGRVHHRRVDPLRLGFQGIRPSTGDVPLLDGSVHPDRSLRHRHGPLGFRLLRCHHGESFHPQLGSQRFHEICPFQEKRAH